MNSELSFIMVPTTKCNLTCSHCFEEHTGRVMSYPELEAVMLKIREYSDLHGIEKITFYWQGGEILTLGLDWFERMDEIVYKLFSSSRIIIRHRLQSNLISYTSEWKPVIEKIFDNSIGSSLDYPNLYRSSSGMCGDRFNEEWLSYCNKVRSDGIDVGVISVLNKESLKIPAEDFLEFYSVTMGISSLQLNFPFDIPTVRRVNGNPNKSFYLTQSGLGKFLVDLFDVWIDESLGWHRRISINPFNELIDVFSLAPRSSRCNCIWSGNCADTFFTIGPDSSVGLCDCWVASLPEFSFGNLQTQSLEEISKNDIRQRFRQRIETILESSCADCSFFGVCFGGCIIRAFGKFSTINSKDPYCGAYKALFSRVQTHIRSTMVQ